MLTLATQLQISPEFIEAQKNAANKILMLVAPHKTIHAFSGFYPLDD